MSAKYELGSKVEIHDGYDYETNCVLCAKALGKNHAEIFLTQTNELITAADYDAAWERDEMGGEYCHVALVGSTCITKFAKQAVSA